MMASFGRMAVHARTVVSTAWTRSWKCSLSTPQIVEMGRSKCSMLAYSMASKVSAFDSSHSVLNADPIQERIETASSVHDLLKIVAENNATAMNAHHYATIIDGLVIQVKKNDELERFVVDAESFETLLEEVSRCMHEYKTRELTKFLEAVYILKIPADSSFSEKLWERLLSSLNRCNMIEIERICYFIQKIKGFSLSKQAVKVALLLSFEEKCIAGLPYFSYSEVYSALILAIVNDFPVQLVERISSMLKDKGDLKVKQILRLIKVTSRKQFYADASAFDSASFREVYLSSLDILAEHVDRLNPEVMDIVLSVFSTPVFSKALYDACWSLAAVREFDLSKLISFGSSGLLHKYVKTEHAKIVRDAILNEATKGPQGLAAINFLEARLSSFLAYIEAAADFPRLTKKTAMLTDDECLTFKAANIVAASNNTLRKTERFKPVYAASALLHLRNLASMGVFPLGQMKNIFNENYQHALLDWTNSSLILKNMLFIENMARIRFGEAGSERFRVIPRLRSLTRAKEKQMAMKNVEFSICLSNMLGGEDFFAENVMTPLDVLADFVIVMRQGDYPMSLSNKKGDNSDLFEKLPADCKIIAIKLFKRASYILDTQTLLPFAAMEVAMLRAQTLCPVAIDAEEWSSIADYEKLPFIMRNIKAALMDGSVYGHRYTS